MRYPLAAQVDSHFTNVALLILAVVVSACVQPQVELKELYMPGHGNQIYSFSYDIRESVKIKSSNEAEIRSLLEKTNKLTIIFNSTSEEDNAAFQVAVFNLASKLPTYYSYEGKLLRIDVLYYGADGNLYNKTKERASLPENTKILLLGPNTDAKETSISLDGNNIVLQGVTKKGVGLAGDKLALVAMGIDEKKVQDISIR